VQFVFFFEMAGLPFFRSRINWKLIKTRKMKKLLFVALIGTLVACGESTSTETTTDSTAVVDTVAAPVVVDTAAPVVADTTAADTAAAH